MSSLTNRLVIEKTVELYDGNKVNLKIKKLTHKEDLELRKKYPNMADPNSDDSLNYGYKILLHNIDSRTFEEPITIDTIQLLSSEDIILLGQAINPQQPKND